MYVRRKRNRSGSTSIVVVDKSSGKYKELECFGTSSDEDELQEFTAKAYDYIHSYGGQLSFDFEEESKS